MTLGFLFRRVLRLALMMQCLLFVNSAAAELRYSFEAGGTVLGNLYISGLPTTHAEVLGFTLTQTGMDYFGFSSPTIVDFSESINSFVDDGAAGLAASNNGISTITCFAPPESSLVPDGYASSFFLRTLHPGKPDVIGIFATETEGSGVVSKTAIGNFTRVVPESGTLQHVLSMLAVIVVRARRMKRALTGCRSATMA